VERRYIACDDSLCAGCELCEFVCAAGKAGSFDLEVSRIHLARPETAVIATVACRACDAPKCIEVCPRDALSLAEDGTLLVDKVRCAGCGWCIEHCEYGDIVLDRRTKMAVVCDLCRELPEPRCVRFCPKGALSVTPAENSR